jgi:AbrB family looped-hinge helix DNA binding protein
MRITGRGQITVPKEIRNRLGLLPHTEVEFKIVGDCLQLRKKGKSMTRGDMIVAHLRGRGNKRFTTDQIMAMTRGDEIRRRIIAP